MADFEKYIPLLFELEGKLGKVTNNKNDKGGWTNAGITINTFRAYYGQNKTVDDLKNMTLDQWKRIAKVYWDECSADKIKNQSIAELVVDWNFNSGITGRKKVQEVFGLSVDGIFGNKTLAALNSDPQKCVFCKIYDAREKYYKRLASLSLSQVGFLNGWLNRLKRFQFC